MTIPVNRQAAVVHSEQRRPAFPLEAQSGSIFLGWGPKI